MKVLMDTILILVLMAAIFGSGWGVASYYYNKEKQQSCISELKSKLTGVLGKDE